jgi:hypothetical protein
MEAKEKAKDIYDKMKGFRVKNTHRKKCALICVDEILYSIEAAHDSVCYLATKGFYQDVKEELIKMQ